jgi:hypothetical protein
VARSIDNLRTQLETVLGRVAELEERLAARDGTDETRGEKRAAGGSAAQ